MKAVLLAGGPVTPTRGLLERLRGAALVVAADGGVRHARPLGLTPDIIVGDFDSATPEELAPFAGVPRQVHPPRKDLLDLELAAAEAERQGASELLFVGALGGRFDQSLAALFIAMRLRERLTVSLHSGWSAAYPLVAGDALTLELPQGQRFSLLSLEPARLSLTGASYPLTRALLPFGVGLGVSNEVAASPLTVTLHEGRAFLVLDC
ncbi:thiamine diphosphokinase [Truepera radiovictrix]|uniref:Thiamine diphosphokinase n=1 Tax=Truepera radiovictrix (strain DSM 17093 / CIP 108686 / LMG 22925 / RQ-24) TaxID=649638 RepID=D7CUD6_TRURR|nr:thiamine diphosphokinase [Truepera radiovictrix]ADI15721.1 thiamine pyrophosphokinase [Truepera radiovictrix DSM 17093]WMT58653.1 thiamine diphosphokinase [Truepera radiovictrix]